MALPFEDKLIQHEVRHVNRGRSSFRSRPHCAILTGGPHCHISQCRVIAKTANKTMLKMPAAIFWNR
jgi:hypothetical protein